MLRWLARTAVALVALLAVGACTADRSSLPSPSASVPPATSPPVPVPVPPARPVAVLVGAGDIADCSNGGDTGTASLLTTVSGTVFTLGDNVYPNGTPSEFARCYDPTWGRQKARTRPVPGNHDYHTGGGVGYFGYFGRAAGTPGYGWYSYEAGAWHVVVLNSNCGVIRGGCAAGSPQERWLRADLAAHRTACTLAMWHHPLFTSGRVHGPSPEVRPLFQALYDAGAELVLTGHNHQYERFAPQTPRGRPDPARGIREFVVGTGGESHYAFGARAANSEVRNGDTYGVLRLTLRPDAYEWRFIPVSGRTFTDSGRTPCH